MEKVKVKSKRKIEIVDRKAPFEFEFLDRYTAGIVLSGEDVGNIRRGKCGISGAWCYVKDSEVWMKGISFGDGTDDDHERKLLLNRTEIRKIMKAVKDTGITVKVIKVFENGRGMFKVDIAVSKGKKSFDKRNSIKEREVERKLKKNLVD